MWLPIDKWEMISNQKKHSLYVKYLATAVWGTDGLKERSIDGKVCNRFGQERGAKRALTPRKLRVVKGKCNVILDLDQVFEAKPLVEKK